MSELRAHFRTSVLPRLAEMRELLDALEAGEGDLPALGRHFHFLAGMGKTFGYPRVSDLGDAVEDILVPMMKRSERPDPAHLQAWRQMVDQVAAELAE